MNITPFIASLICLLGVASTQAQVIEDAALSALIEADKFEQAIKAAQAKIVAQADDVDAYTALGIAASSGDVSLSVREAALKQLEDCASRMPKAAQCHTGVGNVAGVIAMQGGMVKALRMAPKIKASFLAALEADPLYTAARSGLVQYYLLAPGIAGGSVAKARDTAVAEQVRQPEQAKLFKAMVQLNEKQWDAAQSSLNAIAPGAFAKDKGLRDEVLSQTLGLAFGLIGDKQATRAKPLFEQVAKARPDMAYGLYGLGRAQLDLGQADEAISSLQQAATLKEANQLPIDYRLGMAYQAKGDKAAAKQAFTKALQHKRTSSDNKQDAEKRLTQLN
jgi:tetratricopeptide (TPR) repeat protein